MERLETFVRVETPEQIELQLEVAGVGSRFLAYAVDLLWQSLFIAVAAAAGFAFLPRAWRTHYDLENPHFPLVWVALVSIAIFAVNFGYFVAFELLWKGQTPGKRSIGLRVVREGGFPVDARASLVRNLLRALDFLPGFYVVGAASIFLTPAGQRIGDLAAGTLVVREPQPGQAARLPPESDSDVQLALDFLARRSHFQWAIAEQLARDLAQAAAARRGLPPPERPDQFLEELARGPR